MQGGNSAHAIAARPSREALCLMFFYIFVTGLACWFRYCEGLTPTSGGLACKFALPISLYLVTAQPSEAGMKVIYQARNGSAISQ